MKKNNILQKLFSSLVLTLCLIGFQHNLTAQTCPIATTSCTAPNSSALIVDEDFENEGLGQLPAGWSYGPGSTNAWVIDNDTESGATGTDTEFCGSQMLVFETSAPVGFGSTSSVEFPVDFTNAVGPINLGYAYYMAGPTVGTLDFRVSTDGGATYTSLWTATGDQGQPVNGGVSDWLTNVINLDVYAGQSVIINILATNGAGGGLTFQGDILIDAVQIVGCAIPCTIAATSPTTITVMNEAGQCGAMASPMAAVAAVCANTTITNDYNGGGGDATDFYPVGTTTVTFSAVNNFGNPITATVDVIVNDTEDPVLDCSSDIFINLDPGACDAVVSFAVSATDNCTTTTGSLATITAGGNGGAVGGMVYFDIENNTGNDIEITSFDMNISAATLVDVYTAATYVGNAANAGAWTLVAQFDATTGPFSGPFPGNGTLTTATGSFTIPPGTTGIGLHTLTASQNYTNGNGANQTYSNGDIQLNLGSASNTPFGGTFNPRVFNGGVAYSVNLDPVITQTSGLPSGSTFPIGTTTISFTATDAAGNTDNCTFDVTVNEFVPSSNVITCNSLVNVSLDENCQAVVGADQILEGNDYGCYDDFQVVFDDGPLEGQPVILGPGNVNQLINVRVINPSGNPCWGTILVEDKIPPVLTCYDLELACDEPLPTEPAPATTANGIVPTLTDGGNGGAVGGTVYFTLTNNTLFDIDIAAQMNITQATLVDVYLTAG
ncbi:MAG: HYR domain-containing protein [Bacteroidota bacterium]